MRFQCNVMRFQCYAMQFTMLSYAIMYVVKYMLELTVMFQCLGTTRLSRLFLIKRPIIKPIDYIWSPFYVKRGTHNFFQTFEVNKVYF